jgi:phosphatidate cytidylyltransferase
VSEGSEKGGQGPRRRTAEGVRIIGADEAQAALEAGEAAGRRPDDQLRFGDVPPAPAGPRPAHRFPLPESVDPSDAVTLPPLAGSRVPEEDPGEYSYGSWEGGAGDDLPPVDPELGARTVEFGVPEASQIPEHGEQPGGGLPAPGVEYWGQAEPESPAAYEPAPESPPEEGITVTGSNPDLPHWTDPPTGEVPRILQEPEYEEDQGEEDLDAWRALGSRGIRWRDGEDDWDEADEMGDLAGDEDPVGALDQTRTEHSDLYSFDEDFERVRSRSNPVVQDDMDDDYDFDEMAPAREPVAPVAAEAAGAAAVGTRRVSSGGVPPRPRGRPASGRRVPPSGGGSDLSSRVVVGGGLIILLIIAYAIGAKALVALTAVIVVAAAAEAYGMLQRAGFRPATLLGLVASLGIVLGAYWRGLDAIPLALVLLFAGSMMWYVLGIVEARPLANVAVTTMVYVWVAVLGSYAAIMLRAHHGKGLFLGAVLVAVATDVLAFLVGRWIGSRPIAPRISPNKTVEGFVGGLVGAIVVGAIVGKELSPWGHSTVHGLVLGLVIGLIAPAGDLFESMMKRDLGVKDSGDVLPGHGGLLDRFDAILLALPAAYYVAVWFDLVH